MAAPSGSGGGEQHYKPLHIFAGASSADPGPCLLILNRAPSGLELVMRDHWSKFSLHVCADGGANRLYDALGKEGEFLPHTICGDLDSARSAVLQHYQDRGSRVLRVGDQDTTDFDKCMKEVLDLRRRGLADFSSVYAMNAMGARFDQTMANVQTLMLFREELAGTPLYLVSEDSIAVLLAGESVVHVDSGLERGECGLVPIGEPCLSCSSTGLEWNLASQPLRFGGLVSTSNQLLPGHPPVRVAASAPLLWTMSHTLCPNTADHTSRL